VFLKAFFLIAILVLSTVPFGCVRATRNQALSPRLRFEGITHGLGEEKGMVFLISNALPKSISFWDIKPDRVVCEIQVKKNGQWTSVNPLSYCATGWETILIKPGDIYRVTLPSYSFRMPWRIGLQYWEVSEGDITKMGTPRQMWTDPLPPIE